MRRKDDDTIRITSATRSQSEDISGRQRRYLISMGIRTACFILAILFKDYWLVWLFLAGSILLPYVAVVIANAGASPDPDLMQRYDPEQPQIEAGTGWRRPIA